MLIDGNGLGLMEWQSASRELILHFEIMDFKNLGDLVTVCGDDRRKAEENVGMVEMGILSECLDKWHHIFRSTRC